MTANEDNAAEAGGDKSAKAARTRRQKPSVTIDLAASPVEPTPEAMTTQPGGEPSSIVESEAVAPPVEVKDPAAVAAPMSEPAQEAGPRPSASAAPGGGFGPLVVGALGGLVVLVLGLIVLAAGLVSLPGREAADAVAAKANDVATLMAGLDSRLAALETRMSGLAEGDVKALSARVSAVEETVKEAGGRIEALAATPAPSVSAAAGSVKDLSPEIAALTAQLAGVADRLSGLEGAAGSGDTATAAVGALNAKVTALDASLKAVSDQLATLAARPPAAVESERAARAVAVGVVRQAAEKGGAFAGDLAMLQTLGLDDAELAALQPLATKGAPSIAVLQAKFGKVADAILDATSAAGPSAGFLDRVAAFGQNLVSIRPTTPIAGNTPEAVVSRMQAAVDEGDLATALDEREGLPESGKATSAAWAAEAADRVAIDGLVDKLAGALTPPAK